MILNYDAGEDSWESLGFQGDQPVDPKGNQSWIFIRRTDAEAEAPILQPTDVKSWFLGKDPDAEKDWRQEEKGITVDEMVGWHHWLNEHEFEKSMGDSEEQGSQACYNSWGHGLATEGQQQSGLNSAPLPKKKKRYAQVSTQKPMNISLLSKEIPANLEIGLSWI